MILVIAEQRDGKLNRASWEAVAAAQAMAGPLPVKVAVLGSTVASIASEIAVASSSQGRDRHRVEAVRSAP